MTLDTTDMSDDELDDVVYYRLTAHDLVRIQHDAAADAVRCLGKLFVPSTDNERAVLNQIVASATWFEYRKGMRMNMPNLPHPSEHEDP